MKLTATRRRRAAPAPTPIPIRAAPPRARPLLKAGCSCGGGCPACTSLSVAPAHDPAELEADRVADQAMRMAEPAFIKPFLAQARVGYYLRVLEEGEVGAGDAVEQVRTDPEGMTVREMFHLLYHEDEKLEGARRALCISALSPGWRGSFEKIVNARRP